MENSVGAHHLWDQCLSWWNLNNEILKRGRKRRNGKRGKKRRRQWRRRKEKKPRRETGEVIQWLKLEPRSAEPM